MEIQSQGGFVKSPTKCVKDVDKIPSLPFRVVRERLSVRKHMVMVFVGAISPATFLAPVVNIQVRRWTSI